MGLASGTTGTRRDNVKMSRTRTGPGSGTDKGHTLKGVPLSRPSHWRPYFMEKNEDLEMSNVTKMKKTRQRKRNTSIKSKEQKMRELESDESVQNSESEDQYSMAEPAARFLLRALQELNLADNTITVKDVLAFADEVREDMGLMIGNEKFLRSLIHFYDEVDYYAPKGPSKTAAHLSEKILQSQINLVKIDREFPF